MAIDCILTIPCLTYLTMRGKTFIIYVGMAHILMLNGNLIMVKKNKRSFTARLSLNSVADCLLFGYGHIDASGRGYQVTRVRYGGQSGGVKLQLPHPDSCALYAIAKPIMGCCPRITIQAIMGRRNISWLEML